jgi:hypothetical protein
MTKNKIDYIYNQPLGFAGASFIAKSIPIASDNPKGWFNCRCGREYEAVISHVKNGNNLSCGCISRKDSALFRPVRLQLLQRLNAMKSRCYNQNHKGYKNYGDRGITVCKEWLESSDKFCQDMSENFLPGLQIDRIDNNKGYFKENCRWVNAKINMGNRRCTQLVHFDGSVTPLSHLASNHQISGGTLRSRIINGDSGDRLIRPVEPDKTILIEYEGRLLSIRALSKQVEISHTTLNYRYKNGDRGDYLLRPLKVKPICIDYQGSLMSLKELSLKLKIHVQCLETRYRKGLRGDQLFAPTLTKLNKNQQTDKNNERI